MEQLRGIELKRFLRKLKKPQSEIYLLLENIQYARNVASIFRTAEAFGVRKIFLTGISQQPPFGKELQKVSRHKEEKVPWEFIQSSNEIIGKLKSRGFDICALEITDASIPLKKYSKKDILLIVGNETYGVINKTLSKCTSSVYIPMFGKGASLSVGTATAIALYSILHNNN